MSLEAIENWALTSPSALYHVGVEVAVYRLAIGAIEAYVECVRHLHIIYVVSGYKLNVVNR